jgi:uncharacterized protein YndB with AHSA1/START domain
MSSSKTSGKATVQKDFRNRSILVSREFRAPLPEVWRAHTDPVLLDQWWGPAPWRAETRTLDFRPGGYWLYAMVSPANEYHWARMDYLHINHHRDFALTDAFCDEQGVVNNALPVSQGTMTFTATPNGTRVDFNMIYATEAALRTIVEMGFEAGITACLDQLEALLARQGAGS